MLFSEIIFVTNFIQRNLIAFEIWSDVLLFHCDLWREQHGVTQFSPTL